MKKQSLLLGFLFLFSSVAAQRFPLAPETNKQVKQIIEWKTYVDPDDDQPTTVKEYVYDFDKKGKLTFYKNYSPSFNFEASLFYDEQGRLKEKKDNFFLSLRQEKLFYYPGREIYYQIVDSVTQLKFVSYKNGKGQSIEEKGFVRGFAQGSKLKLFSRRVLNYNGIDSLIGEMLYFYDEDGVFEKKKVIHYYDPKTRLKSKKVMHDVDGSMFAQYNYYYDDEKRVNLIEKSWFDKDWKSTKKYMYKDGRLWQEILQDQKSKTKQVKVFKEGRLIREKEYENGKLTSYTDFQYLYW